MQPAQNTVASGFVIGCVKIIKHDRNNKPIDAKRVALFLDRNRQWRCKPITEAWVHSPEAVKFLRHQSHVNGREPQTLTPAEYDGENTIPIGKAKPFFG